MRPPIDKERVKRDARRKILESGLLACYEIIDRIRKELAKLDKEDQKR